MPGPTRLKAKFIVAPASNADSALSVGLAKYARLPWDAILGAELSHTFKPRAARAAAAPHLPRPDVLMVAAHDQDLVAASQLGLQMAFIPRPLAHGPGQTIALRAEHSFTCVATDLLDLAAQLGA